MSTGGALHSGVNVGGTGVWRALPPRLGPPHLTLTRRRTGQFQRQLPGHPERPPRSTPTRPYLRAPTRPQPDCACASPASRAGPESGGRTRAHLARTAAVSLLRGTRPPTRRWLLPGTGAGAAVRGQAEAGGARLRIGHRAHRLPGDVVPAGIAQACP